MVINCHGTVKNTLNMLPQSTSDGIGDKNEWYQSSGK